MFRPVAQANNPACLELRNFYFPPSLWMIFLQPAPGPFSAELGVFFQGIDSRGDGHHS
jgi:hypothetical protein